MPERPPEPPFDPRYDRPRDPRPGYRDDPRFDPRNDPRFDPRDDPRFDPRDDPRFDTRYDRADPRVPPREEPPFDPRTEPRYDPRYDPRVERTREPERAPPPPPPPPPASAPVGGDRPASRGRTLAIILGLLGVLLIGLFAYRLTRSGPGQDRLDEGAAANVATGATSSAERCGTQRTYDLVKRELFRRAAQERGSGAAAFDRLSAYAAVRVEAPVLKRQDEELGTQVCSGRVSIDLPPGVAVVGGRRTLTADVDYALQPAADRSGDVVTLSGAEPIIVPLATLARTGSQPGLPQPQAPAEEPGAQQQPGSIQPAPIPPARPSAPVAPRENPPVPRPTPPEPPAVPAPAPTQASARPSFNCANARTRGEVAVCNDSGLAALDRQMAGFYFRSLRSANPTQRALLQRTRGSFLAFRDNCRSDSCVAGAYRDRMREIADIMADRWVAPR